MSSGELQAGDRIMIKINPASKRGMYFIDLLNAQSALAAARLQGVQAALDWHVSRASLAKAVGTLDSRLLAPATDVSLP